MNTYSRTGNRLRCAILFVPLPGYAALALDASALSEDHQTTVDSILAERIEIVRGLATLMYGSGAAGGLVNIVDNRIARSELDDAVSGSFALGADSALQKREVAGQIVFGSELIAVSADYMRRDTGDVEIPGFAESDAVRVAVNIDLSYRLQAVDLLLFLHGTNLTDVEARQHSSPLKDLAPLPGRSSHAGSRYDF